MSTYAIGDIQGCFAQLKDLLEKIDFKSDKDKLWFAGDIINRGPDSLKTIRFIKSLEDNAITVLGNHDLHLLAIANGHKKQGKRDTIQEILDAKDSQAILDWLIQRPLFYYQEKHNVCMSHAGIFPEWNIHQALTYSAEVQNILTGHQSHEFFRHMYGDKPAKWSVHLSGWDRLRFITNVFTRMRYLRDDMKLSLKEKGAPGKQPDNIKPWFEFERPDSQLNIVFGHWSTLKNPNIDYLHPLDTGCLWGGELTALKISSKMKKRITINCPQSKPIVKPSS